MTEQPFVVLDLETLRGPDEVEGGWDNRLGFGLAVACTWDSTGGFQFWYEDDAKRLVDYLGGFSRVVGFNILRFDYEVLSAYHPTKHLDERTYDILVGVEQALGRRLKLQTLAQATLGQSKSGTGEEVLTWWRKGEKEKVERYCRNDVAITRDLYLHVLSGRPLKYITRYGDVDIIRIELPH